MAYYRHLKRAFLEYVTDPEFDGKPTSRCEYPFRCGTAKSARGTMPCAKVNARRRSLELSRLACGAIRSPSSRRRHQARHTDLAAAADGQRPQRHEPRDVYRSFGVKHRCKFADEQRRADLRAARARTAARISRCFRILRRGRRLLRYGGRPAVRARRAVWSISSAAGCPTTTRRTAPFGGSIR
jgi:hypothetical protein